MEFGLVTFADLAGGISPEQRMRNLLEEARLADEVGLDLFTLGEHHRPDFLISAPAIALAAIAAQTKRIRVSSAVTILSSEDPVRVFQQFAEIDLISGGRAEIMVGRGSFKESFPLFGFDLDDYDALYDERLALLLALRDAERVTWSGRHRAALNDAGVYPRPAQRPCPIWMAAGGGPGSVQRAAAAGLPMTIAANGGSFEQFVPLVGSYRAAWTAAGHDPTAAKVAISSIGHLATTRAMADEEFAAPYLAFLNAIRAERGIPTLSRADYERESLPDNVLAVGAPKQAVEKILKAHDLLGIDRYFNHMSFGAVKHRDVLRSIELFGTEVVPRVRAELSQRPKPAEPA